MKKDIRNDISRHREAEDKGLSLLELIIPILSKHFHIRITFNNSYHWEGTEKKPFLPIEFCRDEVQVSDGDYNKSLSKKDRALLDELLIKHGIYTVTGWRETIRIYEEAELKKVIHNVIEGTKRNLQKYQNDIILLKKKQSLIKLNPDLFDTRDRNDIFEEIEHTQKRIVSDQKELKRINRILSKSQDNLLKLMAILD